MNIAPLNVNLAAHLSPLQTTTRYSGRIGGLDLARGLAIIGMICVHTQPDTLAATGLSSFLIEIPTGRSAALFAVLAGVAISIMTGRNMAYTGEQMRHAQLRIVSRAVFLFAIAALLAILRTPIIVILGFYALWFLAAIPFVQLQVRQLIACSLGLALVGPTVAIVLKATVNHYDLVPAGDVNSALYDALIAGTYPGLAFMAYVFAGMALGRLDLSTKVLHRLLIIMGATLAVVSYGLSWIACTTFAKAALVGQTWGSVHVLKNISDQVFPDSAMFPGDTAPTVP